MQFLLSYLLPPLARKSYQNDSSIIHAENETTEMAKRDKNNKQGISIDAKHKLQQHELDWKQRAQNATLHLNSSINRAIKQVKHAVANSKTYALHHRKQFECIRMAMLQP